MGRRSPLPALRQGDSFWSDALAGFDTAIRNALARAPNGRRETRERIYAAARASLERNLARLGTEPKAAESQRERLAETIAKIEAEWAPATPMSGSMAGTAAVAGAAEDRPPTAHAPAESAASTMTGSPTVLPQRADPITASAPASEQSAERAVLEPPSLAPTPAEPSRSTDSVDSRDTPERVARPAPGVFERGAEDGEEVESSPQLRGSATTVPASSPPAASDADRTVAFDEQPMSTSFRPGMPQPSADATVPAPSSEPVAGDATLAGVTAADRVASTSKGPAASRGKGANKQAREKKGWFGRGARSKDGSEAPSGERTADLSTAEPAIGAASSEPIESEVATPEPRRKRGQATGKARKKGRAAARGAKKAPKKRKGRGIATLLSLALIAGVGVLAYQWVQQSGMMIERPEDRPVAITVPGTEIEARRETVSLEGWIELLPDATVEGAEPGTGGDSYTVSGPTIIRLEGGSVSELGSRARFDLLVRALGGADVSMAVTCDLAGETCGRKRFPVPREPTERLFDASIGQNGALVLNIRPGADDGPFELLAVRALPLS